MTDPNSSENIVDPLKACLDAQFERDNVVDEFADNFGNWIDDDPLSSLGDVVSSGIDAWDAIDIADTLCDIANPAPEVPVTDVNVDFGLDF